ncbi:hypothetical protein BDV59DRAFT_167128 [Aspergillus ambiguus]|uniref:transcription factor TFIIIB subunit BDP1 n=1 Tax=Aspergillus ambiguus TaxID=176160 RepID=UPI003CCCB2CC
MKSFSSSAINKSGKKFAPKAPARRAAPAPPPRRPSVASQASTAQTPQPAATSATPEPSRRGSTTEPTASSEPSTQNPPATATQNATPVPVPIPQPKRKASFSTTATSIIPTPPQPSPPPARTSPAEPAPPTTIGVPSNHRQERASISGLHEEDESHIPPEVHPSIESATEARPSKRARTASITAPVEIPPLQDASNLITPPATQATDGLTTEESDRAQSQIPPGQLRKLSKSKSRKTSKDESATGKERKRRVRRKREPTPEGAEDIEIAPSLIKMSELCKDLKSGKKSTREMELRKMDQEELERKQKSQQELLKEESAAPKQSDERASIDNLVDKQSQSGPQMRIVNGEIVLDTTSLQVDRHADAARNAGELEDVVENSLTRRINQSSYGKRSKTESWDEDMTDLFYRGLRMFGTDFMMISKFFPGRSRRQIKLKFNNEERRDPERIKETLLGPREAIDITTYSEMTNTVYDDPKLVQQELDEEKKRIEDQHAKEKQAQEELLRNPDGAADGDAQDKNNSAPTKGKRNRKQSKNAGDGTEEILGTIDDF